MHPRPLVRGSGSSAVIDCEAGVSRKGRNEICGSAEAGKLDPERGQLNGDPIAPLILHSYPIFFSQVRAAGDGDGRLAGVLFLGGC